ncbi:hypothetical protein [Streptomyces sp. NPDC037389]|uniref:hypothetical protein n=1 Tax=Streptomyces sp. NPDC037389 TaxID=3155369 RepID=UPI0033CC5A79
MTTQQPQNSRPFGHGTDRSGVSAPIRGGVNTLIARSAAEQVSTLLAAARTVPVPAGVLQAVVVLLEELKSNTDPAIREAATATISGIEDAMRTAPKVAPPNH